MLAGKRYDFVLANINRNILLADMPVYAATLTPGGMLLVSGILEADISAIESRAAACGLDADGRAQAQRLGGGAFCQESYYT